MSAMTGGGDSVVDKSGERDAESDNFGYEDEDFEVGSSRRL